MTTAPSSTTRARPLRMRLLMLAATGLVPLVLVLAWGIDHLVAERREQAEASVQALARAMATAVDAQLHSAEVLLDHMGFADSLETADLHGFHVEALRTVEQLGWREITLADGEGRVLLRTSEPFGTSSTQPQEPDSLLRVLETRRPAVSKVVEVPGDVPHFWVRVPVMRTGKLVYVISAALPTDSIYRVLTQQDIPANTVAAVFDQRHWRVARSRAADQPQASASLQVLLNEGSSQGVGRTITREGVESYTGYTRLPGSGWVVAVGTSVTGANQGLLDLLRAVALGLAASLALSALLAWVLARRVVDPIDTLKAGAAALGRGQPVDLPPLHIVELDDVAVALREAAMERDTAAIEREALAVQAQEALQMAEGANRSKDQFLAMLGHELRNPLAPIANAVQIMAARGDEKTAQERRIIERQLGHVTRLVDDLLDISRITGKRLAIHKQPLRIAQLLAQVADTIRPSIHQRQLYLELVAGVEDAWVAGDEVRLVQVFNNLLVNAIKFTPQGGTIRIAARLENESSVRIDVIDTGIGLAREELPRVFDLFYQAPQNADRAQGGLGLGLPIVRSLVEMHGGTVHADSEGPGRGVCISVRLPLCEAPETRESAPAPLPPAAETAAVASAGRVLVVDDNEDAADTCAALLEMHGYTVRVAYTPEGALDLLRGFTPDIAILDIGLPGMTGYELARRMKSPPHDYAGRLVALTGYGQAADRAASARAGFDWHLTKPVAPAELLELVGKLAQGEETA